MAEVPKEYNQYMQKSADYIKIYWEFHKDRLTSGKIPFAVNVDDVTQPFDLHKRVADFRNGGIAYPRNVVREYNQGVFLAMSNSLDVLKFALYRKFDPARVPDEEPHEDVPDFYLDASVYNLFVDISVNSLSYSRNTAIPNPTEGRVIEAGLRTGIDVPIQMRAVLGDEYMAKDSVTVSKIDLSYLQPAKTMTGMRSFLSFREPSFGLFHPDTRVNKELLVYMKRDKPVGCPASRIASLEIRDRLHENGKDGNMIMLPEFCDMMSASYGVLVEDWYRTLGRIDKSRFVTDEAEELLSGEVWDVIKARAAHRYEL